MILLCEAYGRAGHLLRTGISGHDQNDIAEVSFTAIVVSQSAVIHYLQQQVKHIRMSFLNFVKQQNAMRVFSHCFCKQPALIKPDISWRRTNQTGDCMPLHVFGHVKAQQLYAHDLCELPTDLSLTDTGRPRKKERANRLVLFVQARPRQFDCSG